MPPHSVLDIRRIKDFGIGTYIRNLVRRLSSLDQTNRYTLVGVGDLTPELAVLPENFEIALYTPAKSRMADDIRFSVFLRRFAAGLYHIPLNAVPLFMPKPYVVTIHDMSSLIFEQQQG